MSKTKKNKVEIPVETVDNYQKMIDYMISTLIFWKKDKEWPINLVLDGIKALSDDLQNYSNGLTEEIPF